MVNWTYTDADGNAQATYQVQIDNDVAFTTPEWDSGVVPQVVSSGSTGSHNTASFGACLATNPSGTGTGTCRLTWNPGSDPDYRARVRVWDSTGLASGWVNQSSCIGLGCGGGGVRWKTPKHAYPLVDFTFTPPSPNAGQNTQFTDSTIYADTGSSGNRAWNWTFGDSTSSNNQNPAHTYVLQGIYNVTNNASDKDGYTCARSKPITVQQKVPTWKEVSPK
jgi:PKD repeat protein